MRTGIEIAYDIIRDAERIEHEQNGKALTSQQVTTIKAGAFLRKILPRDPDDKLCKSDAVNR